MAENTYRAFDSRKDKLAVNYRNCEKCQMCDNYGNATCKVVEGSISPEATCDQWTMRSAPKYRDKDFFLEEYEKSDRYKKQILDELKEKGK